MPEGRHGDSDRFKPRYYGLRAFGWKWKAYRLLENTGHVRPRPLSVFFNSSSVFGSKLHPGASTTNSCCFSYAGSSCGHVYRVPLFITVPTHPSASRDAGVQGCLSQFVSTGIMMYSECFVWSVFFFTTLSASQTAQCRLLNVTVCFFF